MFFERYEDAQMVEEGRRYKVILVSNHKTGTTGRPKIIVAPEISHFLEEYVWKVRSQISAESVYLFPTLKGNH